MQEEYLKGIGDSGIVMLMYPSEKHIQTIGDVASYLLSTRRKGCILCLARPAAHMIASLKEAGVETPRLLFIDAVSGSEGSANLQGSDTFFVFAPTELTKIATRVSLAIDGGCSFLIIDSITTLSIYVSPALLLRFVHGIVTKGRAEGTTIAIMIAKTEEKQGSKNIQVFVDKIIEVK